MRPYIELKEKLAQAGLGISFGVLGYIITMRKLSHYSFGDEDFHSVVPFVRYLMVSGYALHYEPRRALLMACCCLLLFLTVCSTEHKTLHTAVVHC